MFSTMGQLLNGKQLTVTRARQPTVSAIIVTLLYWLVTLRLLLQKLLYFYHAVCYLTNLHSDYSSLIRIPALKQLLQIWKNETQRDRTNGECYQLVRLSHGYEIEIDIQRLRIGHTYLTHRHLLRWLLTKFVV